MEFLPQFYRQLLILSKQNTNDEEEMKILLKLTIQNKIYLTNVRKCAL